jgi:hypothetical protein
MKLPEKCHCGDAVTPAAVSRGLAALILFLLSGFLPIFVGAIGPEKGNERACVKDPYQLVWTHDEGQTRGLTRFFLDLNGDGKPELFIAATSLIGNGGGPFHVFLSSSSCYTDVGSVFLSSGDFEVLNSVHHGLRDIKVYSHLSSATGTLAVYQFDGIKFQMSAERVIKSEEFSKEIKPVTVQFEQSSDAEHWEPIVSHL